MQEIIKEYEEIKQKWYKMSKEDLRRLCEIWEIVWDRRIQLNSEYLENKNSLENAKALDSIYLKEKTDDKGKKLYSDVIVKKMIDTKYQNEDLNQIKDKAFLEMIDNKIKVIPEYINLVKKFTIL